MKKIVIVALCVFLCGCGITNKKEIRNPTTEAITNATMGEITEAITEVMTEATTTEETTTEAQTAKEPQEISLNASWEFAGNSVINTGVAVKYFAQNNRKEITIAINAGHGTEGGSSVKTLCHPDGSPKTTGGSTAEGATLATAVSAGMTFLDGTTEASVTLATARILKELLLEKGYDVVMLRDSEDVQLDNVARTVIANNTADCHISLHWDGDGKDYDKGAFAIMVPDSIKNMYPVSDVWEKDELLGKTLVKGLADIGVAIFDTTLAVDLTQTSYSTIPTVDMELGNQCSTHDEAALRVLAEGLLLGIDEFY